MPMEGAMEYSESTAEIIDNEVREIISEQYTNALNILKDKKDLLEKAVVILLEKEKIEGEELKALMDKISSKSQQDMKTQLNVG
jgi:cell division protease FtsH